jgi:hypothetical protein
MVAGLDLKAILAFAQQLALDVSHGTLAAYRTLPKRMIMNIAVVRWPAGRWR